MQIRNLQPVLQTISWDLVIIKIMLIVYVEYNYSSMPYF